MEEKTYTITIDASNGKTWVDFSYQVNDHINKEIRFEKAEHYMQFIDLLHEAGYKDVTKALTTQTN